MSTIPLYGDTASCYDSVVSETLAAEVVWRKSFRAPSAKLTCPSNLAIPISYFCVGFLGSFVGTPLRVFMVHTLNLSPAQQNCIFVLMTLPWSFKLVYGFMSDCLPLFGLRRKPYLCAGFFIYSTCYLSLAMIAVESLTLPMLSMLLFFATVGLIMGDVMADTLVVERARLEEEQHKGQLQASCYAIRFLGSVSGCSLGAITFNAQQWGWGLTFPQVCAVCALVPTLLLAPAIANLHEEEWLGAGKSVKDQCRDIWATITLKAVWRPMSFVYVFNLFQVPNVAWSSFLQLSLGFTPFMLGIMATVGSLMTFAGIMAYKRWFFKVSWRIIYAGSVFVTTTFSLAQLCLIFQWNKTYLHMSNWLFALGDDVITEYIQGLQFLPVCLMYLQLCPDGSEGATYSMLTTMGNIALVCASSIGTLVGRLWDVSNSTLSSHSYDGLWRLTVCTSLLSPIPLVLLKLLPATKDDQERLKANPQRSAIGGAVFLSVLLCSLLWASSQAILVVMRHQE